MEALRPVQLPLGDPEALTDQVRGIVLEVVADQFAIQLSKIREMLSAAQAARSVVPEPPGPSAHDTPAQPAGEEPREPGMPFAAAGGDAGSEPSDDKSEDSHN